MNTLTSCVKVIKQRWTLTLYIDWKGAGEEERLERWHSPSRLAVAQLLWNGLLPAHSWVGTSHRRWHRPPAAAGRRQWWWAHWAIVSGCHVLVIGVVEVWLDRQVHGYSAVHHGVVARWGWAGRCTILLGHGKEFGSMPRAVWQRVGENSWGVGKRALWILRLESWRKRGWLAVLLAASGTILCEVLVRVELRLVIQLGINEGGVGQIVGDNWQLRLFDFRHFLHFNCGLQTMFSQK